jgi:ketosteroid isomerase-like protein
VGAFARRFGRSSSTKPRWRYAPSIVKTLSPEFLDRFHEHFDCWNRGELDLMQSMYTEDAVFDVSAVFTDVPPVRGHDAMRRYWMELHETWDGIRLEPVEGFVAGDGRLILVTRLTGVGRRSGAEVDQKLTMLYTLRPGDNKVTHAQLLPDTAAAISAAESSVSEPA